MLLARHDQGIEDAARRQISIVGQPGIKPQIHMQKMLERQPLPLVLHGFARAFLQKQGRLLLGGHVLDQAGPARDGDKAGQVLDQVKQGLVDSLPVNQPFTPWVTAPSMAARPGRGH